MRVKFYSCATCGQIVEIVEDSGVPLICCGEEMEELIPGTADAVREKHVPVVRMEGNKVIVSVGSILHPMTESHRIDWIVLQTKNCIQRRGLKPDEDPIVCFRICGADEVSAVYAYCNLHGLWKAECGE